MLVADPFSTCYDEQRDILEEFLDAYEEFAELKEANSPPSRQADSPGTSTETSPSGTFPTSDPSGAETATPRTGLCVPASLIAPTAPLIVHPQRWSEEQVRAWWDKRTKRRKDVEKPPKGTDGRNIMRWNQARFEQLCSGNSAVAMALYQDLRNEIERFEQYRKTGHVPEAAKLPAILAGDDFAPRLRSASGEEALKRLDLPRRGVNGVSPGRHGVGVIVTQLPEDERIRRPSNPQVKAPPTTAASTPTQVKSHTSGAATPTQAKPGQLKFSPAPRRGEATPSFRRAGTSPGSSTPNGPGVNGKGSLGVGLGGARHQTSSTVSPKPSSARSKDASNRSSSTGVSRAKSVPRIRPPQSSKSPTTVKSTPGSPRNVSSGVATPTGPPPSRAPRAVAPSRAMQLSLTARAARKLPKDGSATKMRSLVMEDLGDETLVQLSSPKRAPGGALVTEEEKQSPSRVSVDDSELQLRCTKTAVVLGVQASSEEAEEVTRRMFDKRELRKRHKVLFDQQIQLWREKRLQEVVTSSSKATSSRVRVCMRKRPLFSYEEEAGEFDVISVRSGLQVVVHNCLTKADLRSLFVSHMGFQFSHAFDEWSTDEEVYQSTASSAVDHVLCGNVSTLFMFGQTGSGKTHTMAGILKRAVSHLYASEDTDAPRPAITLTAFEIAGKTMRDLLYRDGAPKELKIMEDKGHKTRVLGAHVCDVHGPEHLLELIHGAQAHRATRATQVNDTSSRSHAVYRILCHFGNSDDGNALTLVDCAGSERREDSTHHDAQSRKDAAEINSTIFALKECFRVMRSAKGQQPPYRESLLTRVLSDSFSSEEAMIVAIGTVSPSATDTEHSIGTLRALQQLQGTQMVFEEREDVVKVKHFEVHPRSWSEDDVRGWVEEAAGGRAKAHLSALTKGTDGKNIVRWPLQRFTQFCSGDQELGSQLYQELRIKIRAAGGGGA